MLGFLVADQNLAFSVALAVMLAVAILEGVATLLGAGLSGVLDALLPDIDVPDVDGPNVQTAGPLTAVLGWLYLGRVPFLVVLVLLLTSFGLGGLVLQSFAQGLFGGLLPGAVAIPLALAGALPLTRLVAGVLAKLMPQDETEAVSRDTFVGRVAVITLGSAKVGYPAQAKLRDRYGQTHYVMVEPDGPEPLAQGTEVLLVAQVGHVFKVIANPNPILVDR